MEDSARDRDRGDVQLGTAYRGVLCCFLATLALFASRAPWGESFWVDEAISWWIVNDSLSDTWRRSIAFQGQSPLYYVILWAASQLFGSSEIALRLPSVLFGASVLVIVYLIAKELLNRRDLALLATTMCLGADGFQRAMLSARPYALALAAAAASMLLTIALSRRPRLSRAIALGIAILLTFYAHYLFVVIIIPHAITLLRARVPLRHLVVVTFITILGAIPGWGQLSSLGARARGLSFAAPPNLSSFLQGSVPLPILIAALAGLAIGVIWGQKYRTSRYFGAAKFLLPYLIAPVIVFLGISLFAGSSLWVPRYWSWQVVPWGVAFAALFGSFVSPRSLRVACIAAGAMILLRVATQAWIVEDWRAAAEIISKEEGAVVLYSGFIEVEGDFRSLPPESERYLSSPLLAYGVSAPIVIAGVTMQDEELQRILSGATTLIAIRSRRGSYRSPDRFVEIAQRSGRLVREVGAGGLVRVYRLQ